MDLGENNYVDHPFTTMPLLDIQYYLIRRYYLELVLELFIL